MLKLAESDANGHSRLDGSPILPAISVPPLTGVATAARLRLLGAVASSAGLVQALVPNAIAKAIDAKKGTVRT